MEQVMDIDEIRNRLPHRDPFLWLDSVLEITESRIVAQRFLSPELSLFAGHYPDFPVFPGVLQCEACFQAGAILISTVAAPQPGQVPVVTRQDKTQFRRLIRPGDTMQLEVELTEQLAKAFFLKGKVTVEGRVTARLEFACTMADVES